METPPRRRKSHLSNWPFEVRSVVQSHTEATLRERIVWSLCRAAADLVWYLGLQAPVAEIINKLEFAYGTLAYFDILMQNIYKLQQGKMENVTLLEGALDVVQQEYPIMLSVSDVQEHLRDCLFHGLQLSWRRRTVLWVWGSHLHSCE